MSNVLRPVSPARRMVGAPLLLIAGLLVACQVGPGASPTPGGSPTSPPTPTPTPSPTPSPTAGEISHSTDPHDVVLRMESGGGFMPMEFFLTQAPQFTLYGDGTVIYQPTDTRTDPFAGQGLLPFKVGHLDEEGVQALLRFALGEGRLLGARENYQNNMVADAGTTIFTLNAADLAKTVSVYALGMEDPNLPADIVDRRGFQKLADTLGGFEARGQAGELGDITDYDPSHYRVFLMPAEGAVPQPDQVVDWPWDDLTSDDFQTTEQDNRPKANLDRAHVEKLIDVPTGGISFIYVRTTDDQLHSVGVRPLFPDELAAEGLG